MHQQLWQLLGPSLVTPRTLLSPRMADHNALIEEPLDMLLTDVTSYMDIHLGISSRTRVVNPLQTMSLLLKIILVNLSHSPKFNISNWLDS